MVGKDKSGRLKFCLVESKSHWQKDQPPFLSRFDNLTRCEFISNPLGLWEHRLTNLAAYLVIVSYKNLSLRCQLRFAERT